MMLANYTSYLTDLNKKGFLILRNFFSAKELKSIRKDLTDSVTVNSQKDFPEVFAIRRLLQTHPQLKSKLLNESLRVLIENLFGGDYFLVKSIYFNKPASSNWFVAYHQDLSISVDKKLPMKGFHIWTFKDQQFGVQPPLEILEKQFTIRIHLDDCKQDNGALRVIPGSHLHGIERTEKFTPALQEEICEIPTGGIMIMHPLLMHASHKNTGDKNRRVLHLEFCNQELPQPLQWAEKELIFNN